MDWTASANAITRELNRGFYSITQPPEFDIREVLAETGIMDAAACTRMPESYLTALYPQETKYGPGYPQLAAFEAAFTRTLNAKLQVGYPEAQAWLVQFVSTYAPLTGARVYDEYGYSFRKLTLDYWEGTKAATNIFGNAYKALMFRMEMYGESLGWFKARRYERLLRLPAYLADTTHEAAVFMTVVEIILCDVYQWLLQGDACITAKHQVSMTRAHAAFTATLVPETTTVIERSLPVAV